MELAYHTARSDGSGTCFCMNGLGTDLLFILERIVEREAAYARRMRKRSDSPETRYLCHGVQWLNNHSFCGHIMIEPDFSSVPVLDRREHDREIAARLILDAIPSMSAEVRIAIELIELNLSNGTAMPLFRAENEMLRNAGNHSIICTLSTRDIYEHGEISLLWRTPRFMILGQQLIDCSICGQMRTDDGYLHLAFCDQVDPFRTDGDDHQIASSMPIWRRVIPPSEYSPETYGVLKAAMYILGLKDGETNDCISA